MIGLTRMLSSKRFILYNNNNNNKRNIIRISTYIKYIYNNNKNNQKRCFYTQLPQGTHINNQSRKYDSKNNNYYYNNNNNNNNQSNDNSRQFKCSNTLLPLIAAVLLYKLGMSPMLFSLLTVEKDKEHSEYSLSSSATSSIYNSQDDFNHNDNNSWIKDVYHKVLQYHTMVIFCEQEPSGSDEPFFKSWKKHRIGEYENRLRFFSHPYKVFQHFSSVVEEQILEKKKGDDKYMTVKDFIRSILPYRSMLKQAHFHHVPSAEMFFQLADTNGDGLICFSEYLLFLTLLATPEYHWKIAFKLFDLNGDGTVSKEEFQKIMNHATSELALGQRMGKNERTLNFNETGLSRMFFGVKGDKSLTFDVFSDFMRRLHLEVLKLEFHQFNVDKETSSISLHDFGVCLLSHINPKNQSTFESKFKSIEFPQERITFQQFHEFDQMIRTRLHDLEMAYRFYTAMSPRGFSKMEFKNIVKSVTKCELTEGQVETIFAIFDSNQDGQLDEHEFLRALKYRNARGMNHSRDLGLKAWFEKVHNCMISNE